MWELHRPLLERRGPVWAPDLPGFGLQDPLPPDDRTLEAYADWIAEGLRRRFRRPARVAGYSMGGTLALLVALRHPRAVAALGLFSTSACWGRGLRRWAGRAFAGLGRTLAMEAFQLSVRVGFSAYDGDPDRASVVRDMVDRAHRPTMLALYRALTGLDLRPRLPEVAPPAVVACGTWDWLAPPTHARELARGLPRAELCIVPRATHLMCLSHVEAFSAILQQFLSLNDRGPSGAEDGSGGREPEDSAWRSERS
ncbi:MAG: alpha/beta fold hydrolase [Deferrisomatales bacterium]